MDQERLNRLLVPSNFKQKNSMPEKNFFLERSIFDTNLNINLGEKLEQIDKKINGPYLTPSAKKKLDSKIINAIDNNHFYDDFLKKLKTENEKIKKVRTRNMKNSVVSNNVKLPVITQDFHHDHGMERSIEIKKSPLIPSKLHILEALKKSDHDIHIPSIDLPPVLETLTKKENEDKKSKVSHVSPTPQSNKRITTNFKVGGEFRSEVKTEGQDKDKDKRSVVSRRIKSECNEGDIEEKEFILPNGVPSILEKQPTKKKNKSCCLPFF